MAFEILPESADRQVTDVDSNSPAAFAWVRAAARGLDRLGVTPNSLSFAAIAPATAAIFAAATGNFVLAAVLVALSGLFDLVDGPYARMSGRTSKFGALLDSTIDRYADAAPLIGLVVFYSGAVWASAIPAGALLAAYSVSYVRARAEGLGIALPKLWMRRTERMVLICAALAAGPVQLTGAKVEAPVTLTLIGVLGALSVIAAVHALVVAAHWQSRTTRSEAAFKTKAQSIRQ